MPHKLPVVLSREEVAKLLGAVGHIGTKRRYQLHTVPGCARGEVVALKVGDIDSQRMTLRVEQGKGRKDRYAMLSPVLLSACVFGGAVARAQGKMPCGGWLFQA